MERPLDLRLDRAAGMPLGVQIHSGIRDAIRSGRLAGGARLPSWRDLAAQLGVARGTVRVAYERLADEQLIVARGALGTHVAGHASERAAPSGDAEPPDRPPFPDFYRAFERAPLPFEIGVPAQDAFPAKLWSRLLARAAREGAAAAVGYPDPRGHPTLRREIAAYLALARGVSCTAEQVIVTAGYAGALGLAVLALGMPGRRAWIEEPSFPITRMALERAGVTIQPVPVDARGLDVAEGLRRAPDATLAVVTPGQQAPLGMALALERRHALLAWARDTGAFILEDDYLGELQLAGRAAPALAAIDSEGRVLHAGTFSKTLSPALRLGYLVVPPTLAQTFGEAAACLAPAPNATVQRAVAAFMAEGHFLRHLRRVKRLCAARRDRVLRGLKAASRDPDAIRAVGCQAVLLPMPDATDDRAAARIALMHGLAPAPLSPWYVERRRSGLLVCVTNLDERRVDADCRWLVTIAAEAGR